MSKRKVFVIVFNDLRNDNRVLNQVFSLGSNGFDVTLMGIQRKTSLPVEEKLNGIKIIRRRLLSRNLERIRYLRTIYFTIYVWVKFIFEAGIKFDIIHCHDLNTLQFGVFMKLIRLGKTKLIYDAHEYETERNGLHGLRKIYIKFKELILIRFCDRVITVSNTIAEEYVRLYGIKKPHVILNCPILRSKEVVKKDLFRERFNVQVEKKIFLYQGYLYPGRGIDVILDAFDRLNLENSVLVFMGEGTLTSKIKENEKYGKSIFVHPFVSGDVLLDHTSSADCGIAFIEDISLSDRYCLPNKLFEYIAAGLPVIGSGLPDLKRFITSHKVGVAAPSNDVAGFIQAFNNLPDLGSSELKESISRTRALFNWDTQERILLSLYNNLK